MRSRWESLHLGLVRSVGSSRASLAFVCMRGEQPEQLGRFATAGEVVAALTDVSGKLSLDDKDLVLAALVRSCGRGDLAGVAVEIMLLGLWPGLSTVFARLLRFFATRENDLAADLVERFTMCAQRLDLTSCTRVACTLVRNTERVVRSMRVLELKKEATFSEIDDQADVSIDLAADRTTEIVELRAWLRRTVPNDVDLVCAVIVDGRDCHDLADSIGESHEAIRKRVYRALGKIRRTIDASVVPDLGVSPALAGHEPRQSMQAVP